MTQAKTLNDLSRRPRGKVTFEQFLEGDWGTHHVEWVKGEVVPMAPVSDEHTHVTVFLLATLSVWIEAHELGIVMHEPFQMKTGPDLPGRSPDLMYISNANLPRLHKTFLEGPADLVVEVISPGTAAIDRGEKFDEYRQGGVKEYWLIDPLRKQAEFYQLKSDQFHPLPIEGDIVRSNLLTGLWLNVNWLWERPAVLSVLKQWGLI
jgi:Uma2 family endonuclease